MHDDDIGIMLLPWNNNFRYWNSLTWIMQHRSVYFILTY